MPDDVGSNSRLSRLWNAAESRGVPLRAILATVAVVGSVYLAGKVAYRLRDVLRLMLIAGFVALLLNPLMAGTTSRRGCGVTRPGWRPTEGSRARSVAAASRPK